MTVNQAESEMLPQSMVEYNTKGDPISDNFLYAVQNGIIRHFWIWKQQ